MRSITRKQAGFGAVEIVLIVAIIGIIGVLGYTVYSRQNDTATDTTTTQSEEIKDEAGLKAAEDELSQLELDAMETSELEAAEADLL